MSRVRIVFVLSDGEEIGEDLASNEDWNLCDNGWIFITEYDPDTKVSARSEAAVIGRRWYPAHRIAEITCDWIPS